MKALLVSFFNSSNLGDLLISDSLKNKVSTYADVICVDYHGNEVIKDLSIEEPINHLNQKNNLKTKIKEFNGRTGLNQLVMRLKRNRALFSYPTFEEQLAKADALVIGGGNMVFDLESDTLSAKRFAYYVELAKKKNLPVFAISLGIGPFHNHYQQKYTAEVLAKCDYITFRDETSLALFKKYQPHKQNVAVVPDPVFFMEKRITKQEKNKIGINLISPYVYTNDLDSQQVEQSYTKLISQLLTEFDEEVVLFNTEAKDYAFCEKVYATFEGNERVHLQKINRLSDLYTLYDQLNLIIGTRMHSMITGFSQGIPIIGLSYQQKVQAMFELLEDSESVYNLADLNHNYSKVIKRMKAKLNGTQTKKKLAQKQLEEFEKNNTTFLNKIFHTKS